MGTNNIAYACLRKQCDEGYRERTAFRWINHDLSAKDVSFREIEEGSNRIANILAQEGVRPGDAVSLFLPRSAELVCAFFGILKNQAAACVLFSTLGEEALFDRISDSNTVVIITKKSMLRKILAIQGKLKDLKKILVLDLEEHQSEQVLSLDKLMAGAGAEFDFPQTCPDETPAFIQYTSGSTGKPKGAMHVHDALDGMVESFNEVLGVEKGDVYWCTADPAWITGLVYGIITPMFCMTQQIQFGGGYRAETWLTILQNERVNTWYTAPTALRMLMQEEDGLFSSYNLENLQRIYSVGEPLNSEVYYWGKRIFNTGIYDTWFQSETGSIMIANKSGMVVKPGSMGKPRGSIEAFILDETFEPLETGRQGHLSLRRGWKSMFRTYYKKEELYQAKFKGEYYITGDLAYKDEDGYFWYVSRADDVINSAGHLVGPFEVESALLEIEEIIDVAVIGADDPILHQKIIAFICLRKNGVWSRELELKCRIYVSNRVSTTAIPQEFHVVERIPKNQSGKILRRVLKAQYEGKDPGDLSTMEEN